MMTGAKQLRQVGFGLLQMREASFDAEPLCLADLGAEQLRQQGFDVT